MIINEMEYKQLHMVWFMNLDTDSGCNFKTYSLENSSKHESKTGYLIVIHKITLGKDC